MTIMRIMKAMYVYALVSDLETFRRITNQFSFFFARSYGRRDRGMDGCNGPTNGRTKEWIDRQRERQRVLQTDGRTKRPTDGQKTGIAS